jgi:hypothetical protein
MKEEPRRGQPANTFKDYIEINEVYAYMRKVIIDQVESFNRCRSDGLGHWAFDRPVMEYVRSCIPKELLPAKLGTSTLDIQERIRDILYPYLKAKNFTPEKFAKWLDDPDRAREFTRHWCNANEPQPKRGSQPRIKLEMLIERNLIFRSTPLIFRYQGHEYVGRMSDSYQVIIDLGQGEEIFRSPDAVFKKGLKTSLDQWDYCFVVNFDGKEIPLKILKERYKQIKCL